MFSYKDINELGPIPCLSCLTLFPIPFRYVVYSCYLINGKKIGKLGSSTVFHSQEFRIVSWRRILMMLCMTRQRPQIVSNGKYNCCYQHHVSVLTATPSFPTLFILYLDYSVILQIVSFGLASLQIYPPGFYQLYFLYTDRIRSLVSDFSMKVRGLFSKPLVWHSRSS